jgi:acetolactate synthase I/II/III large subunit
MCERWRQSQEAVINCEDGLTRPERICSDLTRLLPDESIVVVDTGHAGMWMGGFFDIRSERQSYLRSCGHLGWAFPAGLGAKCAAPERPTVVFTGDAGLWYHIAEIETAVRWRINTITVVNNNSSGNQSKRGFGRAYDGQPTERSLELWTYTDVDFARLAETIGAVGLSVKAPKEFAPALGKALSIDRPVIIDVKTSRDVTAPLAVSG